MHLNHSKTITSLHVWSIKKLSSMKFVPGAKKFGDHCLRELVSEPVWSKQLSNSWSLKQLACSLGEQAKCLRAEWDSSIELLYEAGFSCVLPCWQPHCLLWCLLIWISTLWPFSLLYRQASGHPQTHCTVTFKEFWFLFPIGLQVLFFRIYRIGSCWSWYVRFHPLVFLCRCTNSSHF